MSIDLISKEIEKIEADSLYLKRNLTELADTYRQLATLKEGLFLSTFVGTATDVLEDLRFKLLENMTLYKIYIREAKGLSVNVQTEDFQNSLLYNKCQLDLISQYFKPETKEYWTGLIKFWSGETSYTHKHE